MRQLILGIMLGSALTGSLVGAGSFYGKDGNGRPPSGSQQQFDYFRQRQQWLDLGHMRSKMDEQRLHDKANPCVR